jgi:hypothetical protein
MKSQTRINIEAAVIASIGALATLAFVVGFMVLLTAR